MIEANEKIQPNGEKRHSINDATGINSLNIERHFGDLAEKMNEQQICDGITTARLDFTGISKRCGMITDDEFVREERLQ